MIDTFASVRLIESPYLTVAVSFVVRRPWRERLFSRPWRPCQRTRTVIQQEPSRGALQLPNGDIVMHPEMARRLRESLATRGKE
jgi:hypothetical protein